MILNELTHECIIYSQLPNHVPDKSADDIFPPTVSTNPHLNGTTIIVSKRNTDKTHLTPKEMIPATRNTMGNITAYSTDKPSVDTPVHLRLYQAMPNLNFFIHDVPTTEHYYACGDLREANELFKLISTNANVSSQVGAINLCNHGFFLYAETLEQLQILVNSLKFTEKPIAEQISSDDMIIHQQTQVEFKRKGHTIHKDIV